MQIIFINDYLKGQMGTKYIITVIGTKNRVLGNPVSFRLKELKDTDKLILRLYKKIDKIIQSTDFELEKYDNPCFTIYIKPT